MTGDPLNRASCPPCSGELGSTAACAACGQAYPWLAGLRGALAESRRARRALAPPARLAPEAGGGNNRRAGDSGRAVGPRAATATRLGALARAIGDQVAEIARVVQPALGAPASTRGRRFAARSNGLSQLHLSRLGLVGRTRRRERAFAGGDSPGHGGKALGRTLVLGAGACRLAYDLHVHCGGTETAVVDVDPYLLVVAEAVIRGSAVSLTESSVNAPEVEPVSRRWSLAAPSGRSRRAGLPLLLGGRHRATIRRMRLRHHRDSLVHRPGAERSRAADRQTARFAGAERPMDQPRVR